MKLHPDAHYRTKAAIAWHKAGGDPALVGPLAGWAVAEARAVAAGHRRHGVIVAESGQILARTVYERGVWSGSTLVITSDVTRLGLDSAHLDAALVQLRRIAGERVIHLGFFELCEGDTKITARTAARLGLA